MFDAYTSRNIPCIP